MNERSLGRLSSAETVRLAAHLAQCPTCRAAEQSDRRIENELRALRGQIPYEVDVRRRVMLEIDRFGSIDRQEVSTWQLGWAAGVAGLGVIALLTLLWGSWPEWRTGAENVLVLLQGLADVSVSLAALSISVLTIPFKLIVGLQTLWTEIPSAAARFEPVAIAGIAVCYLAMAGTIVKVVGRDLRHASTATRED
jgi:hypothetical protein